MPSSVRYAATSVSLAAFSKFQGLPAKGTLTKIPQVCIFTSMVEMQQCLGTWQPMDEITREEQNHDESIEENGKDLEYKGDVNSSRSQKARTAELNNRTNKNKTNAITYSRSLHGAKSTKQWISSNAFINYVQVFRKNFAGLRSTKIFQMAGERWRNMSPEKKQPYLKAAASIKKRRQSEREVENIDKLDTNTENPPKQDTHKQEKVGKKERKKREPKNTAKRKRKSDSDCDSIASGTTASNTTDDLTDESS